MKKSNKLIIALTVGIVVAAVVLAVGVLKGGNILFFNNGSSTLGSSQYVIQTPSATGTTAPRNTEAWVDFDKFASDLATATDTTNDTTTTTAPNTATQAPSVTVIYVVDPSSIFKPSEPVETTEPEVVDYTYTVDPSTNTVTVNKYLGKDKIVWVPEPIGAKKVTAIGENCFDGQSIESVCIRKNITYIGNSAFRNCTKLTDVVFMEGAYDISYIGDQAFRGCLKLKSINFPVTTQFGQFAFAECVALERVTIKNGATKIGDYCFSNCSGLKEITIPKSVSYIGTAALPSDAPNLVVKCYLGSDGEEAAEKYGLKTEYIDEIE